jgi:glycosyltransferase involved in cell wall biosynthesis
MNILVFTTAFYPSIGGIEKHTSCLIEEFLKKGHKIKIIAFPIYAGVKEVIITKESKVWVHYNPGLFTVFLLFKWCDVLYMPNFSLKAAGFILFRPFKKWIISHNDISLSHKSRIKIRMTRLLIKLASHNISVSKHIGNFINANSKIIYNCYDNDTFKIYENEERKYEFVFLGRLVSQKGCVLLIKACKSLSCSFILNVIGDGPERNKLERMVKDLGLKKTFIF